MYKKILLPLDGSKLAEKVLKFTTELTKRMPGVEVVLLHVYNPSERSVKRIHQGYIEQAAETFRKYVGQMIQVQVKSELKIGYPAEEILHYSKGNNIDLIILATHGRSGINRWAMGSVTYKVMRSSNIPVCIIRANIDQQVILEKANGRTILVPLDGDKYSEGVLPYVERLVKQIGVEEIEVRLIKVCKKPRIPSDYPSDLPLSWEEHVKRELLAAKLDSSPYLMEISSQLQNRGIKVQFDILLGNPGDEIIKYAKDNDTSLIAMVNHGHSGLSRWAYGSVAETVMLGTLTPILMITIK